MILEEGSYDELDQTFLRRFQALIALLSFVLLFTVFSLIIWGASRPYRAEVVVKVCHSFVLRNIYFILSQMIDWYPTV